MSLILAILAQIGPFPAARTIPPRAVEGRDERAKPRVAAATPPAQPSRFQLCLTAAEREPGEAVASANGWLANSKGTARTPPYQCLGTAQSNLAQWSAAEQSFLAARDAAAAGDKALRAQLGAMAANAALAAGTADRALALLDTAQADAGAAGDIHLSGEVAIDRARALVALKREGEAAMALDEARNASPQNPEAWLLSATLSRRMGKLAEAQTQIVEAARLLPIDPEIGLEAGVIAVLSGHEDAARKSWQSVLTVAPQSQAAATAGGYLEQLGAKGQEKP
jgi:Flp pilus assembly protein TadD